MAERFSKINNVSEAELGKVTSEFASYFLGVLGITDVSAGKQAAADVANEPTSEIGVDEYFSKVMVAAIRATIVKNPAFLSESVSEKYQNGSIYPYRDVSQDRDKFIPESEEALADNYLEKVLSTLNEDQKLLFGLYFMAGVDMDQIRQLTRTKIGDVSANMQFIKEQLKTNMQAAILTPGKLTTLSTKNVFLDRLANGFIEDYDKNNNYVLSGKTIEETVVEEAVVEETVVEEKPQDVKIAEEVIVEEKQVKAKEKKKQEKKKPEKKKSEKIKSEKQKDEKKKVVKKKFDIKRLLQNKDIRRYAIVTAFAVVIVCCLIIFSIKLVNSSAKKGDVVSPEEKAKQQELADNSLGSVEVVLKFSDINAPEDTQNASDYMEGTTYNLDIDYKFKADKTDESDCKTSLQYAKLTDYLTKDTYDEQKASLESLGKDFYLFDDDAHTISTNMDWVETDEHTAAGYNEEEYLDWVVIMDSCMNQISFQGDGCDLMPLMPDNMTTELNGKIYKLYFTTANGFYIEDKAAVATEGTSKNYIITMNAYLLDL